MSKRKQRINISLMLILSMIASFYSEVTISKAYNMNGGIYNNGAYGISINIGAAPYTTFKTYAYGDAAYGPKGCAWFASARANQLTGRGNTIWSGSSWWSKAESLGYNKGAAFPNQKALVCYSGHVSVLEGYSGNNVIISEGGNTDFSGNSYCAILEKSKAVVTGNGFLGFVYLGVLEERWEMILKDVLMS